MQAIQWDRSSQYVDEEAVESAHQNCSEEGDDDLHDSSDDSTLGGFIVKDSRPYVSIFSRHLSLPGKIHAKKIRVSRKRLSSRRMLMSRQRLARLHARRSESDDSESLFDVTEAGEGRSLSYFAATKGGSSGTPGYSGGHGVFEDSEDETGGRAGSCPLKKRIVIRTDTEEDVSVGCNGVGVSVPSTGCDGDGVRVTRLVGDGAGMNPPTDIIRVTEGCGFLIKDLDWIRPWLESLRFESHEVHRGIYVKGIVSGSGDNEIPE